MFIKFLIRRRNSKALKCWEELIKHSQKVESSLQEGDLVKALKATKEMDREFLVVCRLLRNAKGKKVIHPNLIPSQIEATNSMLYTLTSSGSPSPTFTQEVYSMLQNKLRIVNLLNTHIRGLLQQVEEKLNQ